MPVFSIRFFVTLAGIFRLEWPESKKYVGCWSSIPQLEEITGRSEEAHDIDRCFSQELKIREINHFLTGVVLRFQKIF